MPAASSSLPTRARDLRFDSLRGLLLVAMALNHVPSDLHWLTDRPLGLFSAAEGFVFLSGLLAGIVFTRQLRTRGRRVVLRAARNRAVRIYAWHLATVLAVFAVVTLAERGFGLVSPNSPRLFHEQPLLGLGLGAVMLYQPGLLDILPMYCVFALLPAAVLPLLEKRRYGAVLGGSFLLWLIAQAAPPIDGAPLFPVHLGSFNLFAWQFLFVLGLVAGHRQARRRVQPAPLPSHPLLVVPAVAFAIYAWGIHHWQWVQPFPDRLFGIVLNKPALGALRLLDFLVVAYLLALFGARWPRALQARPLAFLGRHSLAVVATQTLVVAMLLLLPAWDAAALPRLAANLALLVLLFGGAWLQSRLGLPIAAVAQRAPLAARQSGPLAANHAYGIRPP